jgi:hypothetical protein
MSLRALKESKPEKCVNTLSALEMLMHSALLVESFIVSVVLILSTKDSGVILLIPLKKASSQNALMNHAYDLLL